MLRALSQTSGDRRGLAPLLILAWGSALVGSDPLASARCQSADPLPADTPAAHASAVLDARVLHAATREPLACNVTIVDAHGRVVTHGQGFGQGFRSSGTFTQPLPPGRTRLRITRGPEFKAFAADLELRPGETNRLEVVLERQVDLRQRGWFAGDSHVHMIHGEKTIPVDFDQVALAAEAEDLRYLSLSHAWTLEAPTPETLAAELTRRSTPDCLLTWNLEAPKNYYRGDAGRCLGHCWTLGMQGRTPAGDDVIGLLLAASAWDYESHKPSFANFESHALIRAQGGAVFYTHPARWWTGPWGGQGGYPKQARMRISNMAVELPLDVLAGPTFDGLDLITGTGEFAADQKAFRLWSLLLNHGYRLAATASSDACFDRPGGAVPGAARLYTFVEGGFSLGAVAQATARGRTFVTTGPLLLTSLDGHPPGNAVPANGRPHTLQVEAWSSGAATGGLARVELLRNGELFQEVALASQPTSFRTNWALTENQTAWYCVRAFGTDERRQRAISGAFFFDPQPWQVPEPVRARVEVGVVAADSGRALDATLAEIRYVGTQPQPGPTHRLADGSGQLLIPATARLQASAPGHDPMTLSPFFDHPELIRFVTHLKDEDLLDWATFERIRALLGEVQLTFRLPAARGP